VSESKRADEGKEEELVHVSQEFGTRPYVRMRGRARVKKKRAKAILGQAEKKTRKSLYAPRRGDGQRIDAKAIHWKNGVCKRVEVER